MSENIERKEKTLVTSNFTFFHNVLKDLFLRAIETLKNSVEYRIRTYCCHVL